MTIETTQRKGNPKLIPLTQGKFAVVDEVDYFYVSQFKWHAAKNGRYWYARRSLTESGRPRQIYMHDAILSPSEGMECHHRDRNGLNNCRDNLLACSHKVHCSYVKRGSRRGRRKGRELRAALCA